MLLSKESEKKPTDEKSEDCKLGGNEFDAEVKDNKKTTSSDTEQAEGGESPSLATSVDSNNVKEESELRIIPDEM